MKNLILYATTAVLLAACGASVPEGNIGRKRAELDSLKTAYKELGVKVKEAEEWLIANDSTVVRNLAAVTAAPVTAGPFIHYVDVHGRVRSDKAADLYSGGGRVRKILVSAGDRVRAGQLLISMDNDLVAKQMAQAEAGYELARTAFEKQQTLWNQQIGSEMQFLQAKSQKEQAEAGLAALREQQRLTNITAPFDGTVDEVMVRVGDMTTPMQAAARVVDLSAVQLEADVPESYLRTIAKNAPVKVSFPSLDETFDAKLDHVGEFIDPSNRTFKIAVRVPKGEGYMRPNLLSDISIEDLRIDSALTVPSRAVLQDVKGDNYVFVIDRTTGDEAKARKVMVKRVSEYKGMMSITPITAGELSGTQHIVDEGAKNVTDGLTVRVANN